MSEDEGGSQHEEVVTSFLDLQRRLRGDENETTEDAGSIEEHDGDADPMPPSTTIVVQEADLQVLITPTALQDEPEAASAARDERLGSVPVTRFPIASAAPAGADEHVAALQGRLEQVEDDLTGVRGSIGRLEAEAEAARAMEAAILDEVSAQREELRRAIDEGFRRLQETLTRLRSAGDDGTDGTD